MVASRRSAAHFVGGVPFQVTTLQEAVDWVIALVSRDHNGVCCRFLNAWNVALAHSEPEYRELLARRGVNFPDGKPVSWILAMRGGLHQRDIPVRGPSLFTEVMRQGVDAHVRHFLLGGSSELLERLKHVLSHRYRGIQIAGTYAPPFAPLTDEYLDECIRRIRPCKPDLVWIGLGTPKQDYASDAIGAALGVPVLGVGAAFDFVAGTKREAPVWIRNYGFEWLFRLISEPRRLWRRYLLGNLRFLVAIVANWAADDPRRREGHGEDR